MENYPRYITAAGRILLSLLFLVSGYFKITHWSAIAGMMASKGMPAVPVLLALAIVLEIGGGSLSCSESALGKLAGSFSCT